MARSPPPEAPTVHAIPLVVVLHTCHAYGMARIRLSTTVDPELLARARALYEGPKSDASLIDAALTAFLAGHRRAEIDAAYAMAYAAQPVDSQDEWGDLESFALAAQRARIAP